MAKVHRTWRRLGATLLTSYLSFLIFVRAAPPPDLASRAHAALAQIDGTVALDGLREPVDVIRDRWGVPHIYARNQDDLFFAQGFVAAQDRLWQLDLWRRTAMGELSEVVGPSAVDRDTFARLLRYRGDMEVEWRSYAPDARRIAEAFTRGVNAQIALVSADRSKLPIEFQLTGTTPEPWTPDAIISRMAGYVMTGNAARELRRALLAKSVGAERTTEFLPVEPDVPVHLPEGLDLADITPDILKLAADADATPVFPEDASQVGSNDWVVAGSRSATGKPLLANDPHRAIRLPSLRYTVHLNAPGWNVIGAGEPALPGIAAGHNDRIAFGFTIVGMDQQDLYVEELDPSDSTRYRYKGQWEPMTIERETIAVRGGAPRSVTLRFTRHGPVVSVDERRHRAYALRWVGAEPGTAGYLASLSLDRARNWDEFLATMARWKVPAENLVYADTDGNIGWVAAGLAPVRSEGNGLLPVPGAGGRYEWTGFLPVSALPQSFNPARGFIATANHNILPSGYPHMLGYEWGAPFRYQRIAERLAAMPHATVYDFERLQHDETSTAARRIIGWLKEALDAPGVVIESDAVYPVDMLSKWDANLSKDSAAAALYELWVPLLTKAAIAATVSSPREREYYGTNPGIDVTVRLLGQLDRSRRAWVMTGAALVDAWNAAEQKMGRDEATWSWGRLHKTRFQHPLATTPERQALFNLGPRPRGGDATTPNATGNGEWETHGASYREVIDVGNWDRCVTINVPGESGQPGSPYYGDLYPLWSDGQYHPMVFSRAAVEHAAAHRLMIKPTSIDH